VFLLLYEAVLNQKIPSKNETEVLNCLLSQKKAKIALHLVNKARVDVKRMLTTSANLEEYNEYLKNGIRIYGLRLNFKSLRSMLDHLLEAYKLKGPKLKKILLKQKVEKNNIKEASNELFCYHMLVQRCLGALLISCMRRIDALFARNTHFLYLRSILVS
jgi:hypothetical protein